MELQRVEKINGKTSNKKEWYRLNKNQVLEVKDNKSRIIFPYKINDEKILRNLFLSSGVGNFLIMAIMVIAFLLVIYNNSINLAECEECLSEPCEVCEKITNTNSVKIGVYDAFGEKDRRNST